MTFRAHVEEDFMANLARLVVIQDHADTRDVLMPNGSWQSVSNHALPAEAPGTPLPYDALPAIAEAIAKHLGKALPSQAEVSVLREVLEVERDRVNEILFAHREAFERKTS